MSSNLQYPNREPELNESLAAVFGPLIAEFHTVLPAVIVAYDANRQRAQVKPLFIRVYEDLEQNEVPVEYPVLSDVPVRFPRGGGAYIHLPLAKGDPVLLLCAQQSIERFLASDGQTAQDPQDARHHHISDAFVLAGLTTDGNPVKGSSSRLRNFSSDEAKFLIIGLEDGSAEFQLRPSGTVLVKAKKLLLGADGLSGDQDGVVRKADFKKLVTWINTTLLTAIKAITVPTPSGPSGVPVNIASFTNAPDPTASSAVLASSG